MIMKYHEKGNKRRIDLKLACLRSCDTSSFIVFVLVACTLLLLLLLLLLDLLLALFLLFGLFSLALLCLLLLFLFVLCFLGVRERKREGVRGRLSTPSRATQELRKEGRERGREAQTIDKTLQVRNARTHRQAPSTPRA
jgi:hypothetical protein